MNEQPAITADSGAPDVGRRKEVIVVVDGVEHQVLAGKYLVSQFKALVGVDASRALDEIVHGELRPLDDNSMIDIKHHEKFVSHVRTGSSS